MASPRCIVYVLPALGVQASYYEPLAAQLREALGAKVNLVELKGPGGDWHRVRANKHKGYAEMASELFDRVYARRNRYPNTPVLLLGHSLGGHIALATASRLGTAVQGVVLVASGTPYWRAWPQEQQGRVRRGIRVINFLNWLLPWYPGNLLGFGGNQPRHLMRQWCAFARTGKLSSIAEFEAEVAHFSKLTTPVLTVTLQGDDFAPLGATDHLLRAFPKAPRQQVTLGDAQLQDIPPKKRHFAWARKPDAVVEQIRLWRDGLQGTE